MCRALNCVSRLDELLAEGKRRESAMVAHVELEEFLVWQCHSSIVILHKLSTN